MAGWESVWASLIQVGIGASHPVRSQSRYPTDILSALLNLQATDAYNSKLLKIFDSYLS